MADESPPHERLKMDESEAASELMVVDRNGDLILEVGHIAPKEEHIELKSEPAAESSSETQSQVEDVSADEEGTDEEEGAASALGSADRSSPIPKEENRLEVKISYMRIRVSAKVLTLASANFNTMLNSNFVEGQLKLSIANPPSLALPGDDPSAMLRLCRIIHYAPGIHQFVKGYGLLHDFVVLCDIYACVGPSEVGSEARWGSFCSVSSLTLNSSVCGTCRSKASSSSPTSWSTTHSSHQLLPLSSS